MQLQQILEQFETDTPDPGERDRRVQMAIDALATGHEVKGVIDGRITTIGLGNDGSLVVTQTWTLPDEIEVQL